VVWKGRGEGRGDLLLDAPRADASQVLVGSMLYGRNWRLNIVEGPARRDGTEVVSGNMLYGETAA